MRTRSSGFSRSSGLKEELSSMTPMREFGVARKYSDFNGLTVPFGNDTLDWLFPRQLFP
jgi:hypothetical protein